jgi:hypothetical protein
MSASPTLLLALFTLPSASAGGDNAGPAEVSQVARDLRLTLLQHLDKETAAHFVIADQVQNP